MQSDPRNIENSNDFNVAIDRLRLKEFKVLL